MPVCVIQGLLSTKAPQLVTGPDGTQATVLFLAPSSDPSTCAYELVSGAEYAALASGTPVAQPFDYATAGAIWTMAFTFVVGLYLVSKSAGMILSMIRR